MKIAYRMVLAQDRHVLALMATELMESGWAPLGAPFVAKDPAIPSSLYYHQTFTLPQDLWEDGKKES